VATLVGLLANIGPATPGIHLAHAWVTVSALGAIGPAAHEVIPALQQCLGLDTGDELLTLIKLSAAEAIRKIGE
jgi:hypothetical protein